MKTDPKARWQGYGFYFKEGFCWTDVSKDIKCRLKQSSVHDVLSMTLKSYSNLVSDKYVVCLINSKLMTFYVNNFVNSTCHFQINDARQIPIVIPSNEQKFKFEKLFDEAFQIQIKKFDSSIPEKQAEKMLLEIQNRLDSMVFELYSINP